MSEEALLERRKKGVPIHDKSYYGLGLVLSEEYGLRVIYHNGNTAGFSSDLYFLPEKGLGFVVLTNMRIASYLLAAIRRKVFELAFGAELKAEEILQAAAKKKAWTARVNSWVATGLEPIAWIDACLGIYWNEDLGSARITRNEDGYWIRFDEWASALGSEIQNNGERLLRLTTAPWCGLGIVAANTGELILDLRGEKYIFRKQQAASEEI